MLTPPAHLEYKVSSIPERNDFNTLSLEKLYGKLRTHEMEQEQRKIIYGAGTVDIKNDELLKIIALTASSYRKPKAKVVKPQNKKDMFFEAEMDDGDLQCDDKRVLHSQRVVADERSYHGYFSVANFSHIRFRKRAGYRPSRKQHQTSEN